MFDRFLNAPPTLFYDIGDVAKGIKCLVYTEVFFQDSS